jgi:hypothetical protein
MPGKMPRMKFLLPLFLTLCLCTFAQDASSAQSGASNPASPDNVRSVKASTHSVAVGNREGKSQKKNKSKDSDEPEDLNSPTFSEGVANIVISHIRDGLEGHSERLMLSVFDGDKMSDYPSFENQIEAFFTHNQSFRVHSRIIQATTEGEKGIILCDFEMEAIPAGDAPPVRKQEQLRFELERGNKGWKIVDLKPRDFFS